MKGKKINQRLISIVLSLIMILGLLSTLSLTAVAATYPEETEAPAPGIDYSQPPLIINGSSNGYEINLTAETLTVPTPTSIQAYSTDGVGKKWTAVKTGVDLFNPKTGAFGTAKFAKLLDKGMTLWLYCGTNFGVKELPDHPDDPDIIKFTEIKKRDPAPKAAVDYQIGADMTGATTGDWVLVAKSTGTLLKAGIEIAAADSKGKTPDGNGYGKFYDGATNGIPMKEMDGTKVVKSVYFARYAPKLSNDIYYPASKSAKITVSSETKAPKYKADYKKEVIKLKKGDMIYAGTGEQLALNPNQPNSVPTPTSMLEAGDLLYIESAKGSEISLSDYLTADPTTVVIWSTGTNKKPATSKQVYTLAPRSVIDLTPTPTSLKLPKGYEVQNNKGKWGSSMPKFTATSIPGRYTFPVRKKATAKATGYIDTVGLAASNWGTLEIICSQADKGKIVITSATITDTWVGWITPGSSAYEGVIFDYADSVDSEDD